MARAISAAENDAAVAQDFLLAQGHLLGRAHVIGITGPPGAGKSTLTGRLAAALVDRGYSLGLLLVDPSSPFTGGAILGDRLRLPDIAQNPQVFVRSMSSRGSMGGLSRGTNDAIKLLDAFGKDIILVETVGTGQAETDVISVVDSVVVVAVPGLGDDIQAMKAGILEIADLFVVNKADLAGADKAERNLLSMVKMQPKTSDWEIPVIRTVALMDEGITELADRLVEHYQFLQKSGLLLAARAARTRTELSELLRVRLMRAMQSQLGAAHYTQLAEEVAAGKLSVYEAANVLWQKFMAQISDNK